MPGYHLREHGPPLPEEAEPIGFLDFLGSLVFSGEHHNILCQPSQAGLANNRYPSRSRNNR